MESKIKVCLIGCGVISGNHIPSLLRLNDVEIAALCDVKPEKAEQRKAQFSLECPVYEDYITMLDEVKPDSIHIMTPHYLHTEMTLEALKRNINVLLEKPVCIKPEDLEILIKAEKESDAKVCVSFQTRYNETVRRALEIAKADGGATSAFATVVWNRNDDYYAQDAWRGRWATEGGGALINQAIHTIDLLCVFLGKPIKMQSLVSKMRHCDNVEVEDTCAAIIDFAGGKRANLLVSTTHSGQDNTTLHIETAQNVIEIRNSHLFVNAKKIQTERPASYLGKKCYGNSHITLIEKFYDALRTGGEMPISLESSLNAMKLVFGAYRSNSQVIDI